MLESDDDETGVECLSAKEVTLSIVKKHVDATEKCAAKQKFNQLGVPKICI